MQPGYATRLLLPGAENANIAIAACAIPRSLLFDAAEAHQWKLAFDHLAHQVARSGIISPQAAAARANTSVSAAWFSQCFAMKASTA
jgi:hypothetical protein